LRQSRRRRSRGGDFATAGQAVLAYRSGNQAVLSGFAGLIHVELLNFAK
jgi:hypothetical protein